MLPQHQSIAHISTESGWRGGEIQIRLLCEGLVKLGWKSTIVAPEGSPLGKWATETGRLHVPWRAANDLDLLAAWRLKDLLQKHNIAIADANTARAHSMAILGRAMGGRYRVVVHRRTNFPIHSGLSTLLKYRSPFVDHFVGISNAITNSLVSKGVPSERITTIPSAINIASYENLERVRCRSHFLSSIRDQLGGREPRFVIGFAAKIERDKGADILVDAFAQIARPYNAHLVMAGIGPLTEPLKQRLASLGLLAFATFPGFVKDMPALLGAVDIFCMPSLQEGLGTAILEAQAAHAFVCGSNVGGIPETIENKVSGLLFKAGSVEDLQQKLVQAMEDTRLREESVKVAYQRLLQTYSLQSMVRNTSRMYQQVLES